MREALRIKWTRLRASGLIALVALTALLLAACGGSTGTTGPVEPPPAAQPTPTTAPAPQQQPRTRNVNLPRDFQISLYRGEDALGGKDPQFSALFARGKPVILNFFAGLCPPCRAEMPDIQSVSAQYKDSVVIFGLDIGPFVGLGSRQDGKALVQELRVTYPTGTTFDRQVVSAYNVFAMPTTVFITPEGKVFRTWSGLLTRAKLVELTEGLLKASGT
ncbi:MAG: TlpA family protein disulfide reductase [Chloroflexi bacterium]|nr:TlpA family protein disulfide reductase [Chloroflexota bacterium]